MLKLLIPLIIVFALAGGGFFLYKNLQKKPVYQPNPSPKITATSTPPIQSPTASPVTKSDTCEVLTKGSEDLPPLYTGVQWQQPTISEYEVPLKTEERKLQGCVIKSNKISVKEKIDIRGYYYDRLLNLGWNNLVSADGPTGGVESYQKENKYLVVSINYDINVENPQFFTSEVFYRE